MIPSDGSLKGINFTMVNIKINGIEYSVEEGTTILEACRQNGIKIPTLCWLKDINAIGACRICVVEMTGARSLVASCVYPLSKFDEGKNIMTHSPAVLQSRKMTLQLLLSDHNMDCLACSRNGNCELQELCKELGVDDTTYFEGEKNEYDTAQSICSVTITSAFTAAVVSPPATSSRVSA